MSNFDSPIVETTNASGAWTRNNDFEVQFASLAGIGSLTTTTYQLKSQGLAESNSLTGSGLVELASENLGPTSTIRDLRELSGLTWEHLAKLFDVSRRALHLWDNGNAMTITNQEKLGRIINAVNVIDTGSVSENRRFLLSSIEGSIPFDLLKEERFEDFCKLIEKFVTREKLPRLSREELAARSPLSPEDIVEARFDSADRSIRKKRKAKARRVKKA